uniref:Uncharacterized protein n=1 Tax=Arundo donax TaxID=35708 RepID=A0A0A8ZLF1_ARUDO
MLFNCHKSSEACHTTARQYCLA